jgi:hypothetical protein
MIVSLWAVSAFSQTMYWEITEHSTDLDILREEISEYIESGLVPVGISYDNMQLHVLYIEAPDLGVDGWYIEWYDTPNGLQNGITDMMNEGYMASGITYTGDLFYVLYIYLDHGATAWQLVPSAKNLNAVQNAIQPYVNQSYLPVGITSLGREYWTLLVQNPGDDCPKLADRIVCRQQPGVDAKHRRQYRARVCALGVHVSG